MSHEIIEHLKKEIAGFSQNREWESAGRVIEVADGIIKLAGLSNAQSQELLSVETPEGPVAALALNLEDETIGALVLGDYTGVVEGARVTGTGTILSVPVGDELVGRVVDPLCAPVDGRGPIFDDVSKAIRRTLENEAPSVVERESVNEPLHTGIKSIDAMIPIGRGQRELIIGDRTTGKTAIALDTIINQQYDASGKRPICIYVAVGQKEAKTARIVEMLREKGAMEYTIVVSAPASSPSAMWYLAPFTGCAIGEYFRDKGEDAVVIYDDLSKHAWAYREISLLLRRPPGREAYPGDIFYLHSRLLERAAKLSKAKGSGSLTALPIIETQLNDVTAYVPTNVISITDGQIYLESDLFNQGVRPAVNVGLSVSRVGSAAQTKAMKKVAGKLRLTLAQFRELQAFVQFASDVDDATKKRIREGQVMTEILKQSDLAPLPFEVQVVIFFAALRGRFNDIALDEIRPAHDAFIEHMQAVGSDTLDTIRTTGVISEETEKELESLVDRFSFTPKSA